MVWDKTCSLELLSQKSAGYGVTVVNSWLARQHPSRMRTVRLPTVGRGHDSSHANFPPSPSMHDPSPAMHTPCGQTDTCENITFLQLRLQAVITLIPSLKWMSTRFTINIFLSLTPWQWKIDECAQAYSSCFAGTPNRFLVTSHMARNNGTANMYK